MNSVDKNNSTIQSINFTIQYDGLKDGEHSMDLSDLSESLQGFSKILTVVGHFVSTGQFVRKYSGTQVRVLTTAKINAGCIEIPVWISGLGLGNLFSGAAGAVLAAIVSYVLSRRDKEQMDHLANALNTAQEQVKEMVEKNQQLQEKNIEFMREVLATINKMAENLNAASRQAVSPIGKTCTSISLIDGKDDTVVHATQTVKDALSKEDAQEISGIDTYVGTITELDLLASTCKISLDESEDANARVSGVIGDPFLTMPDGPYIQAFAKQSKLKVTAKATVSKDGRITKLYISDACLIEE